MQLRLQKQSYKKETKQILRKEGWPTPNHLSGDHTGTAHILTHIDIADKKVSIITFFSLIWMGLTHPVSYLCAYVSTSSMHGSWFADGELLLENALSFHMKVLKVSPFFDSPIL